MNIYAAMMSMLLTYTSPFDYASLYSKLDGAKYHVSNDTSNELAFVPLLKPLLRHFPDKKTALLGCGTCAALPRMHILTQGNAYGMEVSSAAIMTAKELGRGTECREPPCLRMGSLLDIPWAADAFDIALSSDVLEHIHPADVTRSIAEITRVTKSVLLLSIATGPSVRQRTELHLSRHNHTWWKTQFEEAGWISVTFPVAVWKRLWNKPSSPRLWNYQGKVCQDNDADVASKPCGNLFFALAKTSRGVLQLSTAAQELGSKMANTA